MATNIRKEEQIMKKEEDILKQEKKMFAEEKEMLKKEQKLEKTVQRNVWISTTVTIFLILSAAGGLIYWKMNAGVVYIDQSQINAPLINLGPTHPGQLQNVYVNEGDIIPASMVVARVGTELIKSKVAGLVVHVVNDIGEQVTSGQAVVTMIDPNESRVVGELDENKGLNNIRVGDRAVFTVDAFGGKQYEGVVDEISPTSHQTDIVFNISDKRQINQFDVKVRFDYNEYPELKNGMSARIWVYYK